jgi:hypothetical protein
MAEDVKMNARWTRPGGEDTLFLGHAAGVDYWMNPKEFVLRYANLPDRIVPISTAEKGSGLSQGECQLVLTWLASRYRGLLKLVEDALDQYVEKHT